MNIVDEFIESLKTQNSTILGIDVTLENSSLHDVFTFVERYENWSVNSLLQNERCSFTLVVTDTLPVLTEKNIHITSVNRKILIFIAEFYALDVLSRDIKINNFKLELKYNINTLQ